MNNILNVTKCGEGGKTCALWPGMPRVTPRSTTGQDGAGRQAPTVVQRVPNTELPHVFENVFSCLSGEGW